MQATTSPPHFCSTTACAPWHGLRSQCTPLTWRTPLRAAACTPQRRPRRRRRRAPRASARAPRQPACRARARSAPDAATVRPRLGARRRRARARRAARRASAGRARCPLPSPRRGRHPRARRRPVRTPRTPAHHRIAQLVSMTIHHTRKRPRC
ncbi:hypothetical protein T492DRAFT_966036 [Pavlovales sp. CCMP2436]|nr:hypothetical protein T492DRAFT_966036 [Pavlovales sp. CCMP2436]